MKKLFIVLFFSLILIPFCGALAIGNDSTTGAATPIDGGSPVEIGNPLGDNIKTPQQLIGRIINTALGLVGSLALLMFIYGGFMWMTAAGNDDRIKKGKETLTWATLGLIVIFSSYALVSYLIKNVIKGG